MLKQYKILVNEGKGSENVLVTVPAGAGARGNPTRITAKPDTRYELQDDLKGKGLGPDQVRGKRVGKNLYLMFEDNGKPDVIIEGYYEPINLQQVPTIVGKAENGSVYEYIPHDPELSSMSTTLKDGYTPAMLSLGGGPIAGGAFELAGLPLVAAAAGGGLGGLGWIAAGLGAAALGGGGGGGGGGTAGPVAPNGGVAPTVTITTDADNNGVVNKTELNGAVTFSVRADFDKTKTAIGDKVVLTDGGSPAVVKTVVLTTQAMVDAGYVTADFAKPAEGATLKVSALLQRDTLSSASGTDSALLDTVSNADPSDPTGSTSLKPVVVITTDTNNDGFVNSTEINGGANFNVSVAFTGKVVAGDTVVVTASNNEPKSFVLTADDIKAGKITSTFTKLANGVALTVTATVKDQNGNESPAGSDTAILDTVVDTATGELKHDAANDTGISSTDNITNNTSPVITGIAEKGAKVIVTVGALVCAEVTADPSTGAYSAKVPGTLASAKYTPKIQVTDLAGNTTTVDGTPFTVDTQDQVNPNNNKNDPNASAIISVTSITDDTGTPNDFVTADQSLKINGSVKNFTTAAGTGGEGDVVYVQVFNKAGVAVQGAAAYVTVDSTGGWTLDNQAVTLPQGEYTVFATIQDAAGNKVKDTTHNFVVSTGTNVGDLKAVADTNSVSEDGATFTVTGNVLTGDAATGNGADIDVLYTYKDLVISKAFFGTTVPPSAIWPVTLNGNYGKLDLNADGSYQYTLDNLKAQALKGGEIKQEVFAYEVKETQGNKLSSQSTLTIDVVGVEDLATTSTTLNGVANTHYPLNMTGSVQGFSLPSALQLNITDADSGQSYFKNLSSNTLITSSAVGGQTFAGGYGGEYHITMNAETTQTDHSYAWSYDSIKQVTPGSKVVHDLLTLTSVDGSSSQTIETMIGDSSTGVVQQDYYSSTAAGLKVTGSGFSTTDTLYLTGANLTLDLTATTTNVTLMDKFDITGAGSNTIKLNVSSLLTADIVNGHHTLYIIGDSGDKVVIAGAGLASAWTHANNQAGDSVYTNAGTNDQLVIDAHITAANISFVTT